MILEVEKLPNCSVAIRFEKPGKEVAEDRKQVLKAFSREVRIPGYRPGKVPSSILETRYKDQIDSELKDRLVNAGIRAAITRDKLRVLSVTSVKDIDLEPDLTFRFKATLNVEPEFELPEYLEIPLTISDPKATEKEIEDFIENLRQRDASFDDVTDRPSQKEDYVVLDSDAFQGEKPLGDVFSELPPNIASHRALWIRLAPGVFLPGFCEQLENMSVGETREFDLEIPADFVVRPIAGEKIRYRTTLQGIKSRILPEVNEEFAAKICGESSLEKFREMVASVVTVGKLQEQENAKRDQVVEHLLSKADFELPANLVESETRRIVDRVVQSNTERGVSEDLLKENSKEIVSGAARSAQNRVRSTSILLKIAEKENITLSQAEFNARLEQLARRSGEDPKAIRRQLEQNGNLGAVEEEFLQSKVIDFLVSKASVTTADGVASGEQTEAPAGEGSAS